MRQYVLYGVTAVLAIYAWRDWFIPCCALVLLMAVMQHEDMPKTIAGVQGLNMWNLLLASVAASWLLSRRARGLEWDMPTKVMLLGGLYALVVLVGFSRMMADRDALVGFTTRSLISEELINTFKWVAPGVMIFDGCRTRRRVMIALGAIVLLYVILAAQVVRRTPPSSAFGGGGSRIQKLRLKTCAGIGYSVPDMSAILAGGSWAVLATWPLWRKRKHRILAVLAAAGVLYGQLLTGGRAGYLAWAAVGLLLCLLRWRKYLLVAPLAPLALYLLFPGTVERMLQGFDVAGPGGATVASEYEITSGRNLMWPHVIEKIEQAPLAGYGRMAMIRTGLRDDLGRMYGISEAFPHPHNIYLEWMLDNGVIGLVPVLAFYGLVLVRAGAMFRDRVNPWCSAVGGVTLAVVGVQLVAGIGSQHFYPRESTVGLWAAAFLTLRVWQERRLAANTVPLGAALTLAAPADLRRKEVVPA